MDKGTVMKTPEDEAFDDIARRQGAWGGGFKAKQAMAADKLQEPDCQATGVCVRSGLYVAPQPAQKPAQLAHIAQFMKELRPAIGPMATMGKSKTTQEWFDIVINEIERLQAAQEKNT